MPFANKNRINEMTTIYILVVMSWVQGTVAGIPSVTFQEFTTLARCETALGKITEVKSDIYNVFCTEK